MPSRGFHQQILQRQGKCVALVDNHTIDRVGLYPPVLVWIFLLTLQLVGLRQSKGGRLSILLANMDAGLTDTPV